MTMRNILKLLPIERLRHPPPLVTVIRLDGVIGPRQWRGGLSLESQAEVLERAFAPDGLSAVALAINSPGGSPVQSALLFRRIRQLADEKNVPVFAFAEDVAASGGYWLALAGDEIYAEEASLLGSIGVVSAGFGLERLIERFGIERRLHTAGDNKALLDPFLPEDPDDVARLAVLQRDIHETFKDHVRRCRGAKIDAADETLFSGTVLTGRMALAKGLIDGIGDLRSVMRARFGDKLRLVPVAAARRRWWRRRARPSVTRIPPGAIPAVLGDVLDFFEARALWARFGL
ncbi:MAG TPA: S49 family peptidase [Stellaceae bacterium]|jgi:signal peptide peptidase SppA|nr:S49 family peptidase [Stellaceae bacterium]